MNDLVGNAAEAPTTSKEDKDKTYYPSIYLSDAPEGMQDIPQEGTATITYKVSSRTTREDGDSGKVHVDISIDVKSFDPERPRPRPGLRPNPRDVVARSLRDFMLGRAQGRD